MKKNPDAFSKTLDDYLSYTEMPWGRLFYRTAWHQIDEHFRENGQTVLDIGCGFGITSAEYAARGNQVTGIEPSEALFEKATEKEADARFICKPFEEIGDAAGRFDWVFCHNQVNKWQVGEEEMKKNPDAFSKTADDYLSYTEMPWGRLFYRTAWHQIDEHFRENGQTALDIGYGFGITSAEYAARGNQVTGIEPSEALFEKATQKETDARFICTPFEEIGDAAGRFDWIFCHNVLEYVEEPEEFLADIGRCQGLGGYLSLIAHNPAGKVMKKAIINKDPAAALASLDHYREFSNVIQTEITTYPVERLTAWLEQSGYEIAARYGIHNLYGYILDNEIKKDEEWHRKAASMELELGRRSPYKDVAVFTHLIARKVGDPRP